MPDFKFLAGNLLMSVGLLCASAGSSAHEESAVSAEAEATQANASVCPKQLQLRSTDQVLQAHLAAFRSANATLIACDYARNAVFMLPGSVARGPDEIQATFAGFLQSAGAINSVSVESMTIENGAALMTYKVDSQHIVVTEGVDTFVASRGRIVLHTAYLGGLSVR